MAKKARSSSVIELLDLVYASTNDATSHSYERLNHAMRNALKLAIGAGFKFDISSKVHVKAAFTSDDDRISALEARIVQLESRMSLQEKLMNGDE